MRGPIETINEEQKVTKKEKKSKAEITIPQLDFELEAPRKIVIREDPQLLETTTQQPLRVDERIEHAD